MTWLLALAFAEEQAEIVVRAHQTVLEAEAALHEDIREMGYWPGISLPGRTRYVHPQIWKPAVTVHDEGFVRVKAHAVTVFFGGATPTNVWATGIWGNPGQARASEERVLTGIHPELLDWREALTAYGLALRREALVLELTELEELPAAVARARVTWMWLNTAETPEGDIVRAQIEDWADEQLGEDFVDSLWSLR